MPRGRGAGRGNRTFLGRLRKAVSNAEFEILFLLFAGVFYITFKYFLYVSCSLVWLRPLPRAACFATCQRSRADRSDVF